MTGRVPVRGGGMPVRGVREGGARKRGGGWLARAELPLASYLEGGGRGKERAVGYSIFNFNLIKVRRYGTNVPVR